MKERPDNNSERIPNAKPPQKFEETVELGKRMSVPEAIHAIGNFDDTSGAAVEAAFLNIREADKENDTVAFDNSVSNGRHCLKIEIYDKEGNRKVFSLIDADTGQPIAHIS